MWETFKFITILVFIISCLLFPTVRTYLSVYGRQRGLGAGGAVGVKLWASVARLAANHFYESAGGQKKTSDFSLTSIVETTKAHPELASSR